MPSYCCCMAQDPHGKSVYNQYDITSPPAEMPLFICIFDAMFLFSFPNFSFALTGLCMCDSYFFFYCAEMFKEALLCSFSMFLGSTKID